MAKKKASTKGIAGGRKFTRRKKKKAGEPKTVRKRPKIELNRKKTEWSAKEIKIEKFFSELGNPLTDEIAMDLLGWESDDGKEGKEKMKKYDAHFTDMDGNRVRCKNNPVNRPFRKSLALRYANEMLRNEWHGLNCETYTLDRDGYVQSGQHRLIGLVFAEQMRANDPEAWDKYHGEGLIKIDGLVVTGIDPRDEVVNTIDLGQKRTLGDVFYRAQTFAEESEAKARKLANSLSHAVRLVWLRAGGKVVSDAPQFPHSEAINFLADHPRIVEALHFIDEREGGRGEGGRRISHYISVGYATGLFYLMATTGTEDEMDFSHWEKAQEFWRKFASGAGLEEGDAILELRNYLPLLLNAEDAGTRDEIVGVVIKAFNHWIDGRSIGKGSLKLGRGKDDKGKTIIVETPCLGGIDTVEGSEPF